jgi:hypothetical protein
MRRQALTKLEVVVIVLVIVVLLICVGFVLPIQIAFFVLFGWAVHLYRLSGLVRVNWTELAGAVVALGIFGYGVHWFCDWLWEAIQAKRSEADANARHAAEGEVKPSPQPAHVDWRAKWSAMIVALVMLMFVAGISMVGVTHHLVWMLGSQEKLTDDATRDVYRRSHSRNNLNHSIGFGLHNYHDTHEHFPPGATADDRGRLLHGWMAAILPYYEEEKLSKTIDFDRAWDDPINAKVFKAPIKTYQLPYPDIPLTDPAGYSMSGYSSNVNVIGGTGPGKELAAITDGTSNTLLAGEAYGNYKPWGHPKNWRDPALGINSSPSGFGGPSKHGGVMVFTDGHVQLLSPDIDPTVISALGTPAGGESIPGGSRWND